MSAACPHLLFPGGVLVEEKPWEHDAAEARTAALMADRSVPAIFEAAFEHTGVRIRVALTGVNAVILLPVFYLAKTAIPPKRRCQSSRQALEQNGNNPRKYDKFIRGIRQCI